MNIPFVEKDSKRQEKICLLFIVSTRKSDEVDESIKKLQSFLSPENSNCYNTTPNTARKILAVIPMDWGYMVDTWTGAIDYYLSSPTNYNSDKPYSSREVGYIRLLNTRIETENCYSDDHCVIHECKPDKCMGYDDIRYWYDRAIYNETIRTDQSTEEHVLEAPSLNLLTELIELFMEQGWIIDINHPEFACGCCVNSRLWNIKMIR